MNHPRAGESAAFEYSNLPVRPPGPLVRLGSKVLRGVRTVQATVAPFAADWEASNRRALAEDGPLWVALGDSMTQGIGAATIDDGWVGQVSDALGRPYRIVNLSTSGARIADVLDRQIPALRGLGVVPDLVTLLIGSNDLTSRDRDGVDAQFAALLDALPVGSVVANLPNPTRTAARVNRRIVAAHAQRRIEVADLIGSRLQSWRGRLAADHFHPNGLGYVGIADAFLSAIRRQRVDRTG